MAAFCEDTLPSYQGIEQIVATTNLLSQYIRVNSDLTDCILSCKDVFTANQRQDESYRIKELERDNAALREILKNYMNVFPALVGLACRENYEAESDIKKRTILCECSSIVQEADLIRKYSKLTANLTGCLESAICAECKSNSAISLATEEISCLESQLRILQENYCNLSNAYKSAKNDFTAAVEERKQFSLLNDSLCTSLQDSMRAIKGLKEDNSKLIKRAEDNEATHELYQIMCLSLQQAMVSIRDLKNDNNSLVEEVEQLSMNPKGQQLDSTIISSLQLALSSVTQLVGDATSLKSENDFLKHLVSEGLSNPPLCNPLQSEGIPSELGITQEVKYLKETSAAKSKVIAELLATNQGLGGALISCISRINELETNMKETLDTSTEEAKDLSAANQNLGGVSTSCINCDSETSYMKEVLATKNMIVADLMITKENLEDALKSSVARIDYQDSCLEESAVQIATLKRCLEEARAEIASQTAQFSVVKTSLESQIGFLEYELASKDSSNGVLCSSLMSAMESIKQLKHDNSLLQQELFDSELQHQQLQEKLNVTTVDRDELNRVVLQLSYSLNVALSSLQSLNTDNKTLVDCLQKDFNELEYLKLLVRSSGIVEVVDSSSGGELRLKTEVKCCLQKLVLSCSYIDEYIKAVSQNFTKSGSINQVCIGILRSNLSVARELEHIFRATYSKGKIDLNISACIDDFKAKKSTIELAQMLEKLEESRISFIQSAGFCRTGSPLKPQPRQPIARDLLLESPSSNIRRCKEKSPEKTPDSAGAAGAGIIRGWNDGLKSMHNSIPISPFEWSPEKSELVKKFYEISPSPRKVKREFLQTVNKEQEYDSKDSCLLLPVVVDEKQEKAADKESSSFANIFVAFLAGIVITSLMLSLSPLLNPHIFG